MRRRRPQAADRDWSPGQDHRLDFAWRVHQAIQEWTRSVDQKASIVLVFVTALGTLAARDVLVEAGGLYDPHGCQLWAVRTMGVLFVFAALLALSVVLPQLRRMETKREAPHRLIYFGHLRHRTAADIKEAFSRLDASSALDQLAEQLHATSRIAWKKHARLQASLVCLVLAAACFAIARLAL